MSNLKWNEVKVSDVKVGDKVKLELASGVVVRGKVTNTLPPSGFVLNNDITFTITGPDQAKIYRLEPNLRRQIIIEFDQTDDDRDRGVAEVLIRAVRITYARKNITYKLHTREG